MEVIRISRYKIGNIEAILIILTIVIARSTLSLPKNLVSQTKSATVLNIIFITVIAVLLGLLIWLIVYLVKR